MVARCKLAATDFNQGQKLEQAKTMSGNNRFNVCFSNVTKNWAAKPTKKQKSMAMFSELVDQTVKAVIEKTAFEEKENIKIPKNIAPIPKPDKKDVVRNQRSRFSVKEVWYYKFP